METWTPGRCVVQGVVVSVVAVVVDVPLQVECRGQPARCGEGSNRQGGAAISAAAVALEVMAVVGVAVTDTTTVGRRCSGVARRRLCG